MLENNDMKLVQLILADITTISVDIIVNSANKSLLGGGGLDYIIHKKAGPLMKEACIQLNKEKGIRPVGSVELTTAGDLPAKYIIHAIAPRWLNGNHNEEQLLCDAYWNALNKANEVQAKIVSFPNLGTGVYKLPKRKAAEIAIGTILPALAYSPSISKVLFVCHGVENYEIYKEIMSNLEDPSIEVKIIPKP